MAFDNGVSPPGGASYAPPLLSFQQFANWRPDDPYKLPMEKAKLEQIQRTADLQKQLGSLDFSDPNVYRKAAALVAGMGNPAEAFQLMQQQPAPLPPGMGGQPQQGQPQGQPQAEPAGQGAPQAAPASVQAKPLPPLGRGPQGDSGAGTVTSLVTDRLPSQNQTTGQAIIQIAQKLGVDPNQDLTPGQIRRAQGLLTNIAPEVAGAGALSFGDRFKGNASAEGGAMPPSANMGTPAPAPRSQAAPIGAGGQQGQGASPAPQAAQGQPQQPLTPQVRLPEGHSDPVEAVAYLRGVADRYTAMPQSNAKAIAQRADAWADRIEQSIQPVKMGPNDTYVDPRTRQPIYQGPGAAALAATAAGQSPSLDADAERYRQTGQLPPNMGRGAQGSIEAKQIRARAAQIEIEKGGDPSEWPKQWQKFRAEGIGLNAGERTKANREENLNLILKAADAAIPAALEASKALPRSQYVPLNKLIQKGEVMSSDPRLVEFGMANLQLAEHWARAMNPTGVMRESDRDKALSFLDTAYGNNTYERAVMQLQKQITRERDAVRGGGTILKKGKTPDPGADAAGGDTAPGGKTPNGLSWSMK